MDFKDEYRIQADRHEISSKVIIQTKNKMHELTKPRRNFAMKTVLIAVTLVSCMGITAFAYEYHQHQYKLTNNNAGKNHEYLKSGSESVQNVDDTDNAVKINATLKDIKADENNMYATVELKTNDGTDLNINTDQCITVMENQGFEKAYFVVDNQNVNFTSVTRTDDGSDGTSAVFELRYSNSSVPITSLKGKDITIILENYHYNVTISQTMNFKYSDVGTMIEECGLAGDNEFTEVGTACTYSSGVRVPAYELKAGDKKIYFSDKYSKTYIDNIGIHESGGQNIKQLFVSIVPENDDVRNELLSNLELFNKETGKYVMAFQPCSQMQINADLTFSMNTGNYVQPDGRIILIINAGMYDYNEVTKCNQVDTTKELLKKFIFTLKPQKEIQTVNNTWNMKFNLENVNTMLSYEVDKNIQKDGANAKIEKVKISDSYFMIEGSAEGDFGLKPMGSIYLILSDGTTIDMGNKIGGSYSSKTGKFSISILLGTLADADDVVGIKIWNNTIELK